MTRTLAAAWAAAITAGAIALHYLRLPGRLGDLAANEPAHVVAHLLLYGTLAALVCTWARDRQQWQVFAVVGVAGLVQEACQTVLFGSAMGRHEAFDLSVDLAAAALVVVARRAWLAARRPVRGSDGAPSAP